MVTIPMDREGYTAKQDQLAKRGIRIIGDHGTAPPYEKVTIKYDYDESKEMLTLKVVDHPMLEPEWAIDNRIKSYFG